MGIVHTGDELIRSVRRQATIPKVGSTGTNDWDILSVLSDIQETKLVPKLMKIREDYFLAKTRIPIMAGTLEYRLPSRATFQKLKRIYFWDGMNQIPTYDNITIHGNYIVLVDGDDDSGNQLEVWYFFRPSSLTLTENCRQIIAVNPTAKTAQLSSAPPASWGASYKVDVHSPESGAEVKLWDATAAIVTDTLTFTVPIDGSTYGTRALAVDDWVCGAGWSVLPALPQEYHPALALATAIRFATIRGDLKLAKALTEELAPDLRDLVGTTDQRIEGRPQRISMQGTHLFPNW